MFLARRFYALGVFLSPGLAFGVGLVTCCHVIGCVLRDRSISSRYGLHLHFYCGTVVTLPTVKLHPEYHRNCIVYNSSLALARRLQVSPTVGCIHQHVSLF